MSGPKSVRSARARALLFVFGGWGWLGYRGQAGPSKPGFHHSWTVYIRRRVYEMDYIRNPVGFEVHSLFLNDLIQLVTSMQSPRLISTMKRKALQVQFPHCSTEEPYSWSCSSKATTEWHLCQVLRLQTTHYQPSIFHGDVSKDSFRFISVCSLGCSCVKEVKDCPDIIVFTQVIAEIWEYSNISPKGGKKLEQSDDQTRCKQAIGLSTPHYLEVKHPKLWS